ncbi:MAG: 3-deoxy-manno-octulosonate-8-phosphatase KdsC [bacterium]
MHDVMNIAQNIKLVIFDIDGVLTDGSLFIGDDGQEYKAFNSKDGHGIRMLLDSGIDVAILTGRTSNVVLHRAKDLGIPHVLQGHRDKRPAFQELLKKTGIKAENICYVGDDVVDLPVMVQVGLAVAVGDAHEKVKQHSHWITHAYGGRGAGRELCELLLESQGLLENKLNSYIEN